VPAVLLLATAAALGATALADRSIRDLADLSLRTTAAEIATAAEPWASAVNPSPGELSRSFSDRIVAYALVADADGVLLFHTNPARQGGRISLTGSEFAGGAAGGPDAGRRIELGTGRPAYEFTRSLRTAGGVPRLLRLVIYTAGADRVLERARGLWLSVASVLVLLWGGGAALLRHGARAERLEERMRRQEELSLVGEMTATLAHEVRNALGGIKGHAQWLDEKTPANDPRKPGFAAIVAATARIENLVGELLMFSREETYDLRDLPVDDVLAAAASSAAAVGAKARVRPAPGILVRADPEKITRALANAVRNAAEASGDGGEVTLAAERRGRNVAITVSDNGPGIAGEALGRLFRPFYTTKGNGTGLGLAYARKVAEGMGGSASLENGTAGGAVFTLTAPAGGRG
jgi:signal transduction histidine kinase